MFGLRSHVRAAAAALALAWCATATDAHAGSPFLEALDPAEAMASPAYRYAAMSNEEAFAELDRRRILYAREKPTHGVRAPIRLTGRLHGVHVHSSLPAEQRPDTPFEVLDARLALSVDDFCAILARHDVDELVHYTMYRPNVPPAGWSRPAAAQATGPAAGSTKDAKREEPARKGGSAKRRTETKSSLDKGQKAPAKGGAKGRTSGRQKTAGDWLTDEDAPLEPKEGFGGDEGVELLLEHDHHHEHAGSAFDGDGDGNARAKAAPKGSKTDKSRAAAPKRTGVSKTSRRTATALRRPPARGAEQEQNTHRNWAPPGTRHPAGLAIDMGAVKKRDGRWLSVASHFDGKIGAKTCGVGAPVPESEAARELRAIVCEARAAGVFTYALTPNFDADHVDHVHFEIKPGVSWFLFH